MAEFKPEKPKDARNFCVLPIEATIDKRLAKNQTAFRVLARICTYTDNVGVTFVSQDRLAADLNVTRQAINKQMKILRDCGYIVYARKRYAGQKTNSIKVIYDGVKSEQEAYSNLTPLQQMEQAEREALERLSKKQVQPTGLHNNTPHETHRLTQVKPTGCTSVNPQVAHNVPSNDTNNVYKEKTDVVNVKQMMTEFCKHADQMGTPRIMNERDTALMTSWIDNGLTLITWRSILGKHVHHCKQNNREIARSLGYFVEPVKRELSKLGSPQLKAMVNQLVRDKKM
jgi:DNA-binding MarR family transcriptional regulator